MGKEHTFCQNFGLFKAFFRIVCAPYIVDNITHYIYAYYSYINDLFVEW